MNYLDYKILKNNKDHFWYKSRKHLIDNIFSYVEDAGHKHAKILDIGSGTGGELEIISKYGEVLATDIDKNVLDVAKKAGYKTRQLNIENEILEFGSYDTISAFDVLEHINNDYFAISNIFKALKNDGYFVFTVPAHPIIFSGHDVITGHKRRYTKKELREKLEREGFEDINLFYWNFILFPAVFFLRIFKKVFIKSFPTDTEVKPTNSFLNKLIFKILKAEADLFFMKKTFPGLSIYGFAKKV